MKYCPSCTATYQNWATMCSDCHVALTNEPPMLQEPELAQPDQAALILLTTVGTVDEAYVVHSLLQANDIQSMLKPFDRGYAAAAIVGTPHAIFVRADELAQAQACLNADVYHSSEYRNRRKPTFRSHIRRC